MRRMLFGRRQRAPHAVWSGHAGSQRRASAGHYRIGPVICSPPALIGAVFVALAAWSWRKWCDVLVDFGNELYVPWRLVEGEVLYRDLAFVVGPASQYFNALLFQMFGVSLSTLIYANLVILAGITFLIDRIFLRLGDRFGATCVCLFFLAIFAFSQYFGVANYNYICPYRHEMTHGLALCLVEFVCLVRYVETRKRWLLLVAGICCGTNALMKIEIFIPSVAIAVLAGGLLVSRELPGWKSIVTSILLFAAGVLGPAILFLVILSRQMTVADALAGMFRQFKLAANPQLTSSYPMYEALMGFDDPSGRLRTIAVHLFGVVAALAAAAGIDFLSRSYQQRRKWLCLGAFIATACLAVYVVPPAVWFDVRVVLPATSLISLFVFLTLAVRRRNTEQEFRTFFAICLWSTLAVLLLLKMPLNAQLGHYGFVLAMPSALLLVHCGVTLVPQHLAKRRGTGDVCRAVMLALVVAWAAPHFRQASYIYAGKDRAVGSGGDVSYHDPRKGYRAAVIPQTIERLKQIMPEKATLLVLPYGIHINYLLRKRNPTPHFLMTPWEMKVAGGEQKVLESIADAVPDFIVIVQQHESGFGYDYFGVDGFGKQITAWVEQNYRLDEESVRRDERGQVAFRAVIYERSARSTAGGRSSGR